MISNTTSTTARLDFISILQSHPKVSIQPFWNAPDGWFDAKRVQVLRSLRQVGINDISPIVSAASTQGGWAILRDTSVVSFFHILETVLNTFVCVGSYRSSSPSTFRWIGGKHLSNTCASGRKTLVIATFKVGWSPSSQPPDQCKFLNSVDFDVRLYSQRPKVRESTPYDRVECSPVPDH